MIHFNRETWTTVFYWEGGILSYITKPTLSYLVYLAIIVTLEKTIGNVNLTIDRSSLGMIMNFLVFLLVFRVNATHRNHQRAAMEVNRFFSTLEGLIDISCSSIAGAKATDPPDLQRTHAEAALVAKLNIIRISLAFAVSFVFHCVMITAVTEMQGEMSEVSLQDLVFLRHRLQGLLYSQEMKLVDQAICVVQESASNPVQENWFSSWWSGSSTCDGPSGPVYRTEVRRHQTTEHDRHHWLLGADVGSDDTDSADPTANVSLLHLPKVIMPMLMMALKEAIGKPWGYNERSWSMFTRYLMQSKFSIAVIHTMSATPTPLPYVQLSHLLVFIFAIFYPLSIDVDAGLCDTVVMPMVIFFTIQGFDTLAKMLESATGHDVTDLNFMELIHNLEIQAKYAFDSSETFRVALQESLDMPIRSFNFNAAKSYLGSKSDVQHLVKPFGAYFQWIPMPTVILESLFQAHGHADALRQVSKIRGKAKLRRLLRLAMNRRHAGQIYTTLEEDGDDIELVDQAVKFIRQDPNLFSHYLVFAGVYDPERNPDADPDQTAQANAHAHWKKHVGGMLSGQSAGRLFGNGELESDRSGVATFREVHVACQSVRGFQAQDMTSLPALVGDHDDAKRPETATATQETSMPFHVDCESGAAASASDISTQGQLRRVTLDGGTGSANGDWFSAGRGPQPRSGPLVANPRLAARRVTLPAVRTVWEDELNFVPSISDGGARPSVTLAQHNSSTSLTALAPATSETPAASSTAQEVPAGHFPGSGVQPGPPPQRVVAVQPHSPATSRSGVLVTGTSSAFDPSTSSSIPLSPVTPRRLEAAVAAGFAATVAANSGSGVSGVAATVPHLPLPGPTSEVALGAQPPSAREPGSAEARFADTALEASDGASSSSGGSPGGGVDPRPVRWARRALGTTSPSSPS